MLALQRLLDIGGVGLQLVGYVIGVVFVVLIIGGSVYRTECVLPNGELSHGWELGETIPYLTGAHPNCEDHSLTRYVLGKTGAMSDVGK